VGRHNLTKLSSGERADKLRLPGESSGSIGETPGSIPSCYGVSVRGRAGFRWGDLQPRFKLGAKGYLEPVRLMRQTPDSQTLRHLVLCCEEEGLRLARSVSGRVNKNPREGMDGWKDL
jgi:hypothetical protein